MCTGPIRVTVAGTLSTDVFNYNFQVLVRPPVITSVSPMSGEVAGGNNVTLQGSGFAGDATVWLVERAADESLTRNRSECVWRNVPGMLCNDTTVRCGARIHSTLVR
jgi:hypothetical protein